MPPAGHETIEQHKNEGGARIFTSFTTFYDVTVPVPRLDVQLYHHLLCAAVTSSTSAVPDFDVVTVSNPPTSGYGLPEGLCFFPCLRVLHSVEGYTCDVTIV